MTKTRAIAYLRVSTREQAESGLGLAAQRAKVEAYAQLYDIDLVEVIEDAGVSAKTIARPGLKRALAMIEEGAADALLVAKLDRLTRSVRDLGDMLETHFRSGGADLLSVGEHVDTRTAAGRLVLNVLGSVSQWERETIGERIKDALSVKKARGERLGAPRYGFRVEKDRDPSDPKNFVARLAEVPEEQVVIGEARKLREGGATIDVVAEALNVAGRRSRSGKKFWPTQVARMLAEA